MGHAVSVLWYSPHRWVRRQYDTTIEGWARALELHDLETTGHTRRLTEMTLHLARALGMSETELVHGRRGALLHDIGKMGIPDGILLKPGSLNEQVYAGVVGGGTPPPAPPRNGEGSQTWARQPRGTSSPPSLAGKGAGGLGSAGDAICLTTRAYTRTNRRGR
ncbi:MAG TPA: hypothetical protein DEP84_11890 [Chloroflexi bacterium]|nr:hypothetical protein [Chloroflexota bacterium]